jgi:hypothetical protein
VTTTRRDKDARTAPDLVDRDFTAVGWDTLWVADITFVPMANGFLYLAVVLDACLLRLDLSPNATGQRTTSCSGAVTERAVASDVAANSFGHRGRQIACLVAEPTNRGRRGRSTS